MDIQNSFFNKNIGKQDVIKSPKGQPSSPFSQLVANWLAKQTTSHDKPAVQLFTWVDPGEEGRPRWRVEQLGGFNPSSWKMFTG